jgi:hypothetical protein
MVNQQILDYINKQLAQNVSKQQITSDLLANGWTASDIEEAFSSLRGVFMVNPTVSVARILIYVSVFLIFTGGGTAYYFYQKQQTENKLPTQVLVTEQSTTNNDGIVTTTKNVEGSFKGDIGNGAKADISVKTDVVQTVDCGSTDCFQQKFAVCQPATVNINAGGLGAVAYKIIGPVTGGCKMIFKYTTNPNPNWVNKEMTCTYDNKIDFQKSIENTFNEVIKGTVTCLGPLYTILRSL